MESIEATTRPATVDESALSTPAQGHLPPVLMPADLRSVLEGIAAGVTVQDEHGRLLFVNDDAARMSGFESPSEMLAATSRDFVERFEMVDEAGRPFDLSRLPGRRVLAGESAEPVLVGFRLRSEQEEHWSMLVARAAHLADGRRVAVNTFHDVTPRIETERGIRASERTTMELAEARRRAEENARMLADAALRLDEAETVDAVIQAAAEVAIPVLADWCAVDLVEPDGAVRRASIGARDDQLRRLVEPLRDHPRLALQRRASRRALATGSTVIIPDIDAYWASEPPDPDSHAALVATGIRSAIAQPLVSRGETIGSMVFATVGERTFDADAVGASLEIANRVALAIGNARLFRDSVQFMRLLDATGDAILMLDPADGRIAYANRGAAEQLERSVDDLAGSPIGDHLDPAGAAALHAAIADLTGLTTDARTVMVELHRPSGSILPVEVRLEYVAPDGAPARILAIARDIRDRIQAQARLRGLAAAEHARAAELNAVIQAMGDGVVVCDRAGRIILANPAAESTFPNVDETSYGDILAELDDPDGLAPQLGRSGGPVELRVRSVEERWVEVSTWPVAASGDRATGHAEETIVLLRDVTEQRQRQAVRDTFIGVLSHELRTPVTTIYAGAKLLSRPGDLPDSTRQEIFDDIVVESERLHRLVEDVVAMTRFGDEGGDVGTEPVLLQRLLPSVVASEDSRWPGVSFEAVLPPGLPTVTADPTYVEQVVRNLLSNAAKYGGPGASVSTVVAAADGEVIVRILDDGPGFPPDEGERLFELFFRSARTSQAAAGAGIGLFVCARLIRAMGGRIWATNRPEGGAEFGFALRVMDEDD